MLRLRKFSVKEADGWFVENWMCWHYFGWNIRLMGRMLVPRIGDASGPSWLHPPKGQGFQQSAFTGLLCFCGLR